MTVKQENSSALIRPCHRCGLTINPKKESWKMKDDQMQHVTCPVSPELQELSTLAPAISAPETRMPGLLPEYLTMDEAAALLRVSKGTIRNRIKSGDLPAKRLRGGQTVLVEKLDVLALLDDISPGSEV